MNAATLVLGVVVLVAGGFALSQGSATFVEGLRAGGLGLVKLVPMLILCFVLAGFVEVLLPKEVVARWLSADSGWRGIAVAWVAGALTPGGGPIGLSLAAGLMRTGAGPGVIVTYLTSMSLLSFIRVPMELGMYGGRLTALRVVASVLLPPIAGGIAQILAGLGNAGTEGP